MIKINCIWDLLNKLKFSKQVTTFANFYLSLSFIYSIFYTNFWFCSWPLNFSFALCSSKREKREILCLQYYINCTIVRYLILFLNFYFLLILSFVPLNFVDTFAGKYQFPWRACDDLQFGGGCSRILVWNSSTGTSTLISCILLHWGWSSNRLGLLKLFYLLYHILECFCFFWSFISNWCLSCSMSYIF